MKKNGFMQGAIIATISIVLTKIIGVLYVIPFYKIIGTKGGALYGYAYNIYNIFLIISSAGIPLAISKITSEYETKKEYDKKNEMFSIAKKIIYIFSILSFLICFILAKPIAELILGNLSGGNTIEDVTFVIRAVSFALLVVPILSISRGYLQGHNYITSASVSQVLEQIVRIAVILIGSYVSLKVLEVPLVYAVGISVFAAALGAIVSYIYLYIKLKKADIVKKANNITKADKKNIVKKLIGYSIPFIIISIANSIYNTTDMILIIRGLNILNYSAIDIEEISSIFTTWGSKLVSIVKAFATGLTISLIPSLVSAYVSKDTEKVNKFFNKSLQILLFVILPLTIFMSIFANEIWNIFYTNSFYGPIVFRFLILVGFFDSASILICSSLQSLYKTKLVYISVISGLIANIILDIPLMLLFDKLGIYPFYGAIVATIIGYTVSMIIPLISLHKNENVTYIETIKLIPKLVLSIIIAMLICLGYHHFIPSYNSIIYILFYLIIIGIISLIIYYLLNKKVLNIILNDKLKFKKK